MAQKSVEAKRLAKYGAPKPDDEANRKKLEKKLADLDKKWHEVKLDSSIQFEQKVEVLKNIKNEIAMTSGSLNKILKRLGVFS